MRRNKRAAVILAVTGLCLAGVVGCGEGNAGSNNQRQARQPGSIQDTTRLSNTDTNRPGSRTPDAGPTLPGVRDIAVDGAYAYAITGDSLVTLALDQPDKPTLAARQVLPRTPRRLVLDAGYAYIACDAGGLQVVSLAKPRELKVAGTFVPENGQVTSVAVQNGVAVLGLPGIGVSVLDVSNPNQPQERKQVSVKGTIREVSIDHQKAFVVADGIAVIDLEHPAQAAVTATFKNKDDLRGIAFHDSHAVLWAQQGLRLMNFGSPARPLVSAQLTTPDITKALGETPQPAAGNGKPPKPAGANRAGAFGGPAGATPKGIAPMTPNPGADLKRSAGDKDETPAVELGARLAVVGDRLYLLRPPGDLWSFSLVENKRFEPLSRITEVDQPSCIAATADLLLVGTVSGDVVVLRLTADGPKKLATLHVEAAPEPLADQPSLPAEAREGLRATPNPTTQPPADAPRPSAL